MKNLINVLFVCFAFSLSSMAQTNNVKGRIVDSDSMQKLKGVNVSILGTSVQQKTDGNGNFLLENVPLGSYFLKIELKGYETQKIALNVKGGSFDLGELFMFPSSSKTGDSGVISLTEEDLLEEEGGADNIAGLLQSSRDVFLNTAAFNFGQSWFRVRGFDSENGTVLINGIPMNKLYGGRPQWSNWGGLNDMVRNQEFSNGSSPNNYVFGGVLGTTAISTRASEYRPGTRLAFSATNKSYVGRMMITHSSGLKNKWAYTVSASRRFSEEGYQDGSFYDANSLAASIEYVPNNKHSINFTSIYAYNRRGKSSANTNEVYDLKGTTYSSYWGYQDGKKRNSRVKELEEPILMLTHLWDISSKTNLNTSISYQFGKIGNSRLGYFNAPNPDPAYYRYLPSYYLRDFSMTPDLANQVAERFQLDDSYSQINWENLYRINKEYGTSRYYLYEDRNDDKQLSFNSVLTTKLSDKITLNVGGTYRNLISDNYAKMLDLLGGSHFNDVDQYTDTKSNLNGNPITNKGDTFSYNYQLTAQVIDAFAQAKFNYSNVDFYTAVKWSSTQYQREGLFKNELYKDNSFGKGKKITFDNNISAKVGATYKITGRHLLDFNAAYITKAPTLRNTYTNSRVNHDTTLGIEAEEIKTVNASYILRLPNVKARLTGYYALFENGTNIARYFNQSLGDFISEVTTGIEKKHFGAELGIEYQVTPTIKATLVGAAGQYTYNNNPLTYHTSDELFLAKATPETSYLRNYKLSGTPQKAFSFGLEYRDPHYWWIGANVNYLADTYINISSGLRTDKFYIDPNTNQPFNGVTQKDIDRLLQQEKFDPYTLVNVMGGKSWKIGRKYIGVFATVNNVFNIKYKTNGYEQGRNGNYKLLSEDQARKTPVFGSKYWYGYGTTFFVNAYISF